MPEPAPGVSAAATGDVRVDPYLHTVVHVVGSRQKRPNRPSTGCPFCVGGLEAPDPYDVRWFHNRFPAMPDERCMVVLYTPQHDATLWSLGVPGVRKVIDLWAERTATLGARDDVEYVLVFENRGAEVGATIAHPHGQIYAYDHVPSRPARLLGAGWQPDTGAPERTVIQQHGWTAFVPFAATYPVSVTVAPTHRVADLPSLSDDQRTGLAGVLVELFERLDRLYDAPLPYMMWINQRPTSADPQAFADAWLHIEIVSPWRSAGVPRYIAAAEVGCDEYFNPVVPEDLAARLRELAG